MPTHNDHSPYNALGIFGRLDPSQEQSFQKLQETYYALSANSEVFGVLPHLTIVVEYKVPKDGLLPFKQLLQELKSQLPLQIAVTGLKIVDDQNIAFTFDRAQTSRIRGIAGKIFPEGVIATDYFTVMHDVPEQFRNEIVGKLSRTKFLHFTDFKLCANRVDESHTLYSSASTLS